jgi:glutamate-1-semialdehyde aminotransferase
MVAGFKTLEILNNSQREYDRINNEGNSLLKNLNQYFTDNKLPILAVGHKSIIMLHTLAKWIENPSMKEIIEFTDKKKEALLHLSLFNRNISGLHGLGSLSMAHEHDHIMQIQKVVEEIGKPISQAQFN